MEALGWQAICHPFKRRLSQCFFLNLKPFEICKRKGYNNGLGRDCTLGSHTLIDIIDYNSMYIYVPFFILSNLLLFLKTFHQSPAEVSKTNLKTGGLIFCSIIILYTINHFRLTHTRRGENSFDFCERRGSEIF